MESEGVYCATQFESRQHLQDFNSDVSVMILSRKETQTFKICSGGILQSHKMAVCNHLLYGAQQSV